MNIPDLSPWDFAGYWLLATTGGAAVGWYLRGIITGRSRHRNHRSPWWNNL